MSAGRFITLEGIEGAGKSTAATFVVATLRAAGLPVLATREPGGTPLAERIRQIVLERGTERVTPVSETLLMFAARALHVENLIRPALSRGEWVVCDRFTDATRAYQGSARGVDAALIEQLARAVHADLEPDCTLLLDVPVAVGLARARARAGAAPADRFEAETVRFFEKVRAGYLGIAQRSPARVRIIDAAASLAQVERQLGEALKELLPRRPP
ncbi:MAG TPA: dTMP kinase [Steroidobacteraceae bacterium]|nr:dTMP kinase [Steroidobacteraceae bacterium]